MLLLLSLLSQHAPHGPAASLLSVRNPTEGSKAILALRLDLTPPGFADIGFKPSPLPSLRGSGTEQPPDMGTSSCMSLPPLCCPPAPWALASVGSVSPRALLPVFPGKATFPHLAGLVSAYIQHCIVAQPRRRLSCWVHLSWKQSRARSRQGSTQEAVGRGARTLPSRAVPSSCQVDHRLSTSPARFLLVSSPCLHCGFTGTATPRYLAYLQVHYIIQ